MDDIHLDAVGLQDMPASFLRKLAEALWEDGKDLARLNLTSKGLRSVCNESAIWQQLVIRRFGDSVVPGMRTEADHVQPVELLGWVFYQGRDGSEDSDQQPPESKDVQQLAQLASGADAFTTSGKVIRVLHKPQEAWKHFSFHPKQGTYVKESVVQQQQLQPPVQPVEGVSWPPEAPGWIYFPSCISEGYTAGQGEPRDTLPRYKELQDVLEAARSDHHIVAVATNGELKAHLRPQACWRVDPLYDVGLYVKTEVAQQMQLVQPPPVPDYQALYAKLDMLRLDASQMWAVWLNDMYLELIHDANSPTDSGMLLHLKGVWWLDLGGAIHGVPPGDYEVCWVVDVKNAHFSRNSEFNLSAQAVPAHPSAATNTATSSTSSSSIGHHAAGTSTSGTNVEQPEEANNITKVYKFDTIDQLRRQCERHHAAWGIISGGVLHVSKHSTVNLRFWSHDSTYKQNMYWAYVDLQPLGQPQQQVGASSQRAAVRALPDLQKPVKGGGGWAPRGARVQTNSRGNTTMSGHGGQQAGMPYYPEMGPMGGLARWFMGVLGGMQGQHQ